MKKKKKKKLRCRSVGLGARDLSSFLSALQTAALCDVKISLVLRELRRLLVRMSGPHLLHAALLRHRL